MKPIATFNVRTRASKHFFRCKVFKTDADMYAYFLSYCKRREKLSNNIEAGHFDKSCQFHAIVNPVEWLKKVDEEWVRHTNIGEALFCKPHLNAALIAHEMLHCAMWHDRLIEGNANAEYGADIGEAEERMGHVLYDFVKSFVNQCRKKKHFQ